MTHRILLVPVVVLAGLLVLAGCRRQNAYIPPPPPEVQVAPPIHRMVTPYFEITGSAAAFNQVDLVARVQGFLQEINYVDGATAKLGDNLFVVEPLPYQAKLQQAQAGLASAKAQLLNSEAEFARQQTLLRQQVTAQNTYDQALAKRDSDRAAVADQDASVTLAAVNYGYTHVAAPFDGQVTRHLVSVGELVGQTGPTKLATIVQLDPIYVTFNVAEQDVLRIRAAVAARQRTDQRVEKPDLSKVPVEVGLMTEDGYPHPGALNYAAPTLDPSTGTLYARALLPNANRAVLPGMFVRIRIPIAIEAGETLLVPTDAIGADQGGRYLLVVGKDDKVEQRTVVAGAEYGNLSAIEKGLGPDDRVIVSGLQRAIPGGKVTPKPVAIGDGK